jgi:hypothetical protein
MPVHGRSGFQALCFLFRTPETQSDVADFAARPGWPDRTRVLAVLFGIVALAETDAVFRASCATLYR